MLMERTDVNSLGLETKVWFCRVVVASDTVEDAQSRKGTMTEILYINYLYPVNTTIHCQLGHITVSRIVLRALGTALEFSLC